MALISSAEVTHCHLTTQLESDWLFYFTYRGWIVCIQQKGWMDGTLMLQWVKEIYLKHTGGKKSVGDGHFQCTLLQ